MSFSDYLPRSWRGSWRGFLLRLKLSWGKPPRAAVEPKRDDDLVTRIRQREGE